MNKDVVTLNERTFTEELLRLFERYADFIVLHQAVVMELRDLLKRSGQEARFISKLDEYLDVLQTRGEDAIGGRGEPMEHLSGSTNLCSMRFLFRNSNIRILFSLQGETACLLLAFYERDDHSITDYSTYILPAKRRLQELMNQGGNENEQ